MSLSNIALKEHLTPKESAGVMNRRTLVLLFVITHYMSVS
jgi:hypothetical protein